MEFRERLWLLYLLVTGLDIALSMFVVYDCSRMFNTNLQSMRHIGEELQQVLEAFYKQVAVESINPFGLLSITAKKCTNFFSNFLLLTSGV